MTVLCSQERPERRERLPLRSLTFLSSPVVGCGGNSRTGQNIRFALFRPDGLFSCRRCSLSFCEFFYGKCLQGIWVEGEPLGNSSRERQGRMRHSISCLWIVSGPSVLRHFGRTRESRGSSDAWNPQNFLATPARGLGGPSRGSGFMPHFGIFRPSELRGEVRLVGIIPKSLKHYLDVLECVEAR